MTHSLRSRRRAAAFLGIALAAVTVLHLLWAAGMDSGLRGALGGMEPPSWIRPAAVAVAAFLALGSVALLQRAGLLRALLPGHWAERITWLLAVALLATSVINLFGRTSLERAAFAPLCLVLGSAALVVAREPRRPGLLDALMPEPTASERHAIRLAASPEQALTAILSLPVADDPVVRTLFRLRRIPSGAADLRSFFSDGTFRVVEDGPRRFAFAERTRGLEIVGDFRAEPDGDGTWLSTETRARGHGVPASLAFRVYWLLIGPFSGLIRRRWLHATRRLVEADRP